MHRCLLSSRLVLRGVMRVLPSRSASDMLQDRLRLKFFTSISAPPIPSLSSTSVHKHEKSQAGSSEQKDPGADRKLVDTLGKLVRESVYFHADNSGILYLLAKRLPTLDLPLLSAVLHLCSRSTGLRIALGPHFGTLTRRLSEFDAGMLTEYASACASTANDQNFHIFKAIGERLQPLLVDLTFEQLVRLNEAFAVIGYKHQPLIMKLETYFMEHPQWLNASDLRSFLRVMSSFQLSHMPVLVAAGDRFGSLASTCSPEDISSILQYLKTLRVPSNQAFVKRVERVCAKKVPLCTAEQLSSLMFGTSMWVDSFPSLPALAATRLCELRDRFTLELLGPLCHAYAKLVCREPLVIACVETQVASILETPQDLNDKSVAALIDILFFFVVFDRRNVSAWNRILSALSTWKGDVKSRQHVLLTSIDRYLTLEGSDLNLSLPLQLKQQFLRSTNKEIRRSVSCNTFADALSRLNYNAESNYDCGHNLIVHFAFPAQKLVVELLGPDLYIKSRSTPVGKKVVEYRQLERDGWKVLKVLADQWTVSRSRIRQQQFITALLKPHGIHPETMASQPTKDVANQAAGATTVPADSTADRVPQGIDSNTS
eukprot:GILK01011427.1.p1 GENE.GILK01011427.1~~GILK01011427.1.p1  ORF type:complete len:600 (-),score=81.46 GILK01011427.1:51-1850(-)